MRLLSIDPGSTHSAFVKLTGEAIGLFGKIPNDDLLAFISDVRAAGTAQHLAIETIVSRGIMPNEAVETQYWVGRFVDRFAGDDSTRFTRIRRGQVRGYFCGAGGDDKQVRSAMIERYGGAAAIGKVKCQTCKGRKLIGLGKARQECQACFLHPGWEIPPGPLANVASDVWAALAVGIFWYDTIGKRQEVKKTA